MKFILVDDDIKSIEMVKSIISTTLFSYDIDYDIVVYNKYTTKLKQEIKDMSELKTYILSVDLKQNISGINIAEYIREFDSDSYIIFLTCHGDMFETVHRNVCNVFEFIEKYQNMEKRLTKDIKKIINYSLDNKCLSYTFLSINYKILYKSIKYIERDTVSRKLIIHTSSKDYISNLSIKEMLNRLDKRFIRVSKSSIINKDYISEINNSKGYAILNDNTVINSISKKYETC